ncbi:MAG TPA: hypothetical protein VKS79_10605, partial [Gemmataceae bacterium]|nr:hypothetical protein [Gemmataceae bacterium]
MLDFPRYRIHARVRGGATVHAAILRPETGEQIGVAEETPPQGLRRFLPRSWRGRQLEVREFPEPALVFRVVFPAGPWHSTVRVYDAMDERMGFF